ncbi:hypothetical protein, partial [Pectobacterium brasiliense]|uniref:hypothetical protein n=1 Tax=Pectobacterium brasiliense TaxID=180957 RepID=UPI0019698EBE
MRHTAAIHMQYIHAPDSGRLYLSRVVISYHYMKQSELPQGAKAINLAIEFKPSDSPITPALTLNGYLE